MFMPHHELTVVVAGRRVSSRCNVDWPLGNPGDRRQVSLLELIDTWEHEHALRDRPAPVTLEEIEAGPVREPGIYLDVPPGSTITIVTPRD
jgi:hypothetical protein